MSAKTKFPSNLSWDEFLALPQETRNAALIDGEVIVNPPNRAHEVVVRNLLTAFTEWTRAEPGRGEVSTQQPVKVNNRNGYQPDVAWYPSDQSPPDIYEPFIGYPALIVEIFSPSTRMYDLKRKRRDYEAVGIGEVWFVDPVLQGIQVCRRSAEGASFVESMLDASELLTSPLLPDFSVVVGELFRR